MIQKNIISPLLNNYGVYDMKRIVLFLVLTSLTFAQSKDPLKYFPYKTGNMWEYYFDDLEYPDTVQVFNIKDSVDAEGNIYVTQIARRINPIEYPLLFPDTATYKIDTAYNVFGPYIQGGPNADSLLIFKLNAKKDDQWVVYDYSHGGGGSYEIARLREIREDELFGRQTTFKFITYYWSEDSTDTLGLDRYGDNLAYGFGLRARGGGDLIGDIILKGCVINDTLYGDTTNIITSVKDISENLPVQFELYPNYPNPFNPLTTISFNLQSSGNISLIVYDAMGREIKRLIDDKRTNYGYHKIIWNGRSNSGQTVSSGVYYYSLISKGKRITRSMILLK